MMAQSFPSISMVAPFLSSAVEITSSHSCRGEFSGFAKYSALAVFEDDDVFDANAAPAGNVNARLNGKHHSFFQGIAPALAQVGVFVDSQPNAMPKPVPEALAIPGFIDHVLGE